MKADPAQLGLGIEVPPTRRGRAYAQSTRERGRRYDPSRSCPLCFRTFTSKGIGRHVAACRAKKELTKALLGA